MHLKRSLLIIYCFFKCLRLKEEVEKAFYHFILTAWYIHFSSHCNYKIIKIKNVENSDSESLLILTLCLIVYYCIFIFLTSTIVSLGCMSSNTTELIWNLFWKCYVWISVWFWGIISFTHKLFSKLIHKYGIEMVCF